MEPWRSAKSAYINSLSGAYALCCVDHVWYVPVTTVVQDRTRIPQSLYLSDLFICTVPGKWQVRYRITLR